MVCPYLIEQLLATPVVLNRMQATCRPAPPPRRHHALLLALAHSRSLSSAEPGPMLSADSEKSSHTGGGNV